MTTKIQDDHKRFWDVIRGRARRELKHLHSTGQIVRMRPNGNGGMIVSIPRVETPRFVHGDTGSGIMRGPGKEGDQFGQDPQPGENGPGNGEGEGIMIQVDMDYILKFLQDELCLPDMKPKPNETFQEIRMKYTNISKVGINALRHPRRTMKEAMKRLAMTEGLQNTVKVSGCDVPMRMITPIKQDFRYRQFREYRVPSSNAVIFMGRDCSGSVDDWRCDVISDMSWWIECWVSKFYEKLERRYFVHDINAEECDRQKFYSYRHGGGTKCSSFFEEIAKQMENKFPPSAYNIYVIYFTDGDNMNDDFEKMTQVVREKLGPENVNLLGLVQVCPYNSKTVKSVFDSEISSGGLHKENIRTYQIGRDHQHLPEEERNTAILQGIKHILSEKAPS